MYEMKNCLEIILQLLSLTKNFKIGLSLIIACSWILYNN